MKTEEQLLGWEELKKLNGLAGVVDISVTAVDFTELESRCKDELRVFVKDLKTIHKTITEFKKKYPQIW